jgi:uncharacterized protein YdeI (YjbR/CyaY-like superfamily)
MIGTGSLLRQRPNATIKAMPVKVDSTKVREFKSFEEFYKWLSKHHDKDHEVWIKIHKLGSGLKSINAKEAIDAALCWGWIDGLRKACDDKSFLQRYTRRGKKSIWSQINVQNVSRLINQVRMTEHGLKPVNAAKADGRWDRAYQGGSEMKLPDDLLAAIHAEPRARDMLQELKSQNRYALAFRIHNMKTEAGRKRKIQTFVAMLKRGETIYPQPKNKD